MSETNRTDQAAFSLVQGRELDEVCTRFEKAWKAASAGGPAPCIEEYLGSASEPAAPALFRELLTIEAAYLRKLGRAIDAADYRRRFPLEDGVISSILGADDGSEVATLPPGAVQVIDADAETLAPSSEPAAQGPAAPGQIVDYEILEELGRGGMGVVYKTRHKKLNRIVALKMILAGSHAGAAELARFRMEAESVARLQHPNIVQIYEIGEQNGLPYFSLEFVAGGSLDKKLNGTPLPAKDAATLVETLAHAMQAAHERGVIHRDLKPANVLLQIADCRLQNEELQSAICNLQSAIPKITDFGLAKKLDDAGGHTATGAVMGTPSYMAPEQAGGKSKEIGPAADIYALGAILYELLTGRPPFKAATTLDTIMQVVADEPVPPSRLQSRVPRDLETICLKCLEKQPAKRYPTARALADDLRCFLNDEPIAARPVTRLERVWKWARKRPAVAALVLLVPLALLAAVGLFVSQSYTATLAEANRNLEKARDEADTAKKGEEEQKLQTQAALKKVEAFRYTGLIALAEREYRGGELGRADELLNDCPEGLRGWEWHYVRRVAHVPRTLWQAHKDFVSNLSYSPDGERLVACGRDGSIYLRDENTFRENTAIHGHNAAVVAAVLGPADHLVSAGADGTIKAWTLTNKKAIFKERPGPNATELWTVRTTAVHGLAYSADGRFIASAHDDKTVKIWNADTGKAVNNLSDHTSPVHTLAFSVDGKRLVAGAANGAACVWDTTTWKLMGNLKNAGWVLSAAFSPDRQHLVIAASQLLQYPRVTVWDLAAGRELFMLQGHIGSVNSVVYCPDGKQIVTAGQDGTVRFWDAMTGQSSSILRGASGQIISLAIRPDGKQLASTAVEYDRPGSVMIWDVTPREESRTFSAGKGKARGLAFSPDGDRVASTSTEESVRVWDAHTGRIVLTLGGHQGGAERVEFSADVQRIATLSAGQAMQIFGAQSSPRVERVMTVRRGVTVNVWNAATGERLHSFPERTGVTFSHDGKQFATAGADNTVTIHRVPTAEPIFAFRPKIDGLSGLTFSPDSRRIAVWGQDPGTGFRLAGLHPIVRLYEVASGQEVLALTGHRTLINAVVFSSDGALLASASLDQTVHIWDAATGKSMHSLRGHLGEVTSLAFSGDSTRLASAGVDGIVRIWDPLMGLEVCTLRGHTAGVFSVDWSRDGRRIAAGLFDGSVKLWEIGQSDMEPKFRNMNP
jgi:WD40 repeat protein/tRNA A-37 threonylcarbamoyl transferase component Bud32